MSRWMISVGLLCAVWSSSRAQESTNEVPHPPYVAKAPVQGQWTVKFSRKDDTAPGAAEDPAETARKSLRVKKITTLTDGPLVQLIVHAQGGGKTEFWFTNRLGVCKDEADGFRILDPRFEAPGMDLTAREFKEFGWINDTCFAGVVSVGERRCYYYKGDVAVEALPGILKEKMTKEAWIDIATKLPVALNDGEALRQYEFDFSPVAPLQLPASFAQRLEKYNQKMKRYGM